MLLFKKLSLSILTLNRVQPWKSISLWCNYPDISNVPSLYNRRLTEIKFLSESRQCAWTTFHSFILSVISSSKLSGFDRFYMPSRRSCWAKQRCCRATDHALLNSCVYVPNYQLLTKARQSFPTSGAFPRFIMTWKRRRKFRPNILNADLQITRWNPLGPAWFLCEAASPRSRCSCSNYSSSCIIGLQLYSVFTGFLSAFISRYRTSECAFAICFECHIHHLA